jgi:FG-GAP-like repeat
VAGGTNVRICIGSGTGTFTLVPTSYTMGTNPRSVALADFNGDGAPDLVSANNGSANVSVRINITAIPGGLAIMIPTAGVGLGSATPGGQVSRSLGAFTVANNRAAGPFTWTATVTASHFTTGGGSPAETITNANVSYWSGPALSNAQMGTGTFTPGQTTAGAAVTLNIPRTAFSHPLGANVSSRAWNPTVRVNIPAFAVAGTYTGTITHSVS